MKATLPIVLLFVSFAVVSGQQHWWEKILPSFSSAPHLSKSQLYAEEFGVQNVRGYVAATGDFDSDKLYVLKSGMDGLGSDRIKR